MHSYIEQLQLHHLLFPTMAQKETNSAVNKHNSPNQDDVKDNSNDEEKTYESKENAEMNAKNQIPQNNEPNPLGQRNKILIGTFEPSTFHYSFKNQKDPLQIGMFPIFGYLQIPHIGVYGDSYGTHSYLSSLIRKHQQHTQNQLN